MAITVDNGALTDYTLASKLISSEQYVKGLTSFYDSGGAFVADASGRNLGSSVGAAYVDPRILPFAFPSTPGSMSAITGMTAATYSAGEGIGTTTTITGAARANGGSGLISKIILLDESAAGPDVFLNLWTSAPTWNNDAASGAVDADGQKLLDMVPFPAGSWLSPSTNFKVSVATVQIPYVCGAATTSLVATFLANGAYTPGATTALKFLLLGTLD